MQRINIRDEASWVGNRELEDAVYGTLDVLMTYSAHDSLTSFSHPEHALVHDFNMGMQAPAFLCTVRGCRVDQEKALAFHSRYALQRHRLENYISGLTLRELGWPLTIQKSDYGGLDLIDAFFGPEEPKTCKVCGGEGRVVTQEATGPRPVLDAEGNPTYYKSGARKGEQKFLDALKERSHVCKVRHEQKGFTLPKPKLAWDAKTNQPSVDKKVLGGIAKKKDKKAAKASRLAAAILMWRGLKKKSDTVTQLLNSPDGRFHPHYAFGGTDTHRAASKRSVMGDSTNGQNITKDIRQLLIPDPGYIMLQGDLVGAESHILGVKANDTAYIAAHEGDEDTHTIVAKMCWPDRAWPEGAVEQEKYARREVFDPSLPRGKLRDVAKTISHARGRDGSKRTVGQTLGIGDNKGQEVIDVFDKAFPNVKKYISALWKELKATGVVRCPELHVSRKFFANPSNHDTLRDALAFVLQLPVAYVCHIAFWRVYRHMDTKSFHPAKGDVQLLFHNHDAVVVQVREDKVDHYLPLLDKALTVPLHINGRVVTLRRDWEKGYNWRDMNGVAA